MPYPQTNVYPDTLHKATHQTGGVDEISIASLLGAPAQKAAASGLASLNASSKVVQDPATVFSKFTSGTYTGDSTVNRAIAHGLAAPKIVLILDCQNVNLWFWINDYYAWLSYMGAAPGWLAVTTMTTTNFYVGNSTDYAKSANYLNYPYRWVAWGV